jgi:hypothetical protein
MALLQRSPPRLHSREVERTGPVWLGRSERVRIVGPETGVRAGGSGLSWALVGASGLPGLWRRVGEEPSLVRSFVNWSA